MRHLNEIIRNTLACQKISCRWEARIQWINILKLWNISIKSMSLLRRTLRKEITNRTSAVFSSLIRAFSQAKRELKDRPKLPATDSTINLKTIAIRISKNRAVLFALVSLIRRIPIKFKAIISELAMRVRVAVKYSETAI